MAISDSTSFDDQLPTTYTANEPVPDIPRATLGYLASLTAAVVGTTGLVTALSLRSRSR